MTATPADPTLRDVVTPVVADVIERAPQVAGHLMLVGALCRDVLHRQEGHLAIRLPTVPGYTALKLASWAARSRYGEYKDAGDLACASYWYLTSSTVEDRLYGGERGQRILTDAWNQDRTTAVVASTVLLADDAMTVLTPSHRAELLARWEGVDDNLLATYSDNPLLPGWPRRGHPGLAEHTRSLRTGMTL
ncbi:hypothetical protein [Cellulomonas shaoxiangyii]|uniref:Uncharacterized protein n=1 Tax=Cellulomonas shaoxiangyii TaxID=2566013 RepID=A0A4V1CMD5_9CELL|nr:hypothetical protein [Cellulomonas shaoxiangyii]QCB92565.1 hypothetical protein E5225_02350 [Cellulomonas shaoxiangyii]TGY77995.1 hypothetical protein E5226_16645 [Cellulomonas shaoxiangyii]